MDEQPGSGQTPLSAPTLVRSPVQNCSAPRTSDLANASIEFGILGIFFSLLAAIPGLVLGIVALYQIKRSRGQLAGRGFAIAGICISLIGAIIVPAIVISYFMQAREEARLASCESDLKDIDVATFMYTQDYDDHFPPAACWGDAVYPYIKDYYKFKCPDDDSGSRSSYAFNATLGGLSFKKIANPAGTVGMFDARADWNTSGSIDLLAPRHNGGASVGFADGHVTWTRGNSIASLRWNPLRSRGSRAPIGPRQKTGAK